MTETTETPALPGDGLRESIVDELRRHIGDGLVEFLLKPQDDLWIRIAADKWAAAGRALQSLGFEYFCFLSAIDWKPSPFGRGEDDPTEPPPERKTEVVQGYAGGETRFQVFARVTDIRRHVGVTLKVDVADEPLALDSWHAIYAGANWHERETHEMFGIDFLGHPDLRNMYLPTEFEGYPLRKDFPLLARLVKPWPGIVDVEPMPAEDADGDGAVDAAADAPAGDAPAADADAAAGDAPVADVAPVEGATVVEEAPDAEVVAGGDAAATAEPVATSADEAEVPSSESDTASVTDSDQSAAPPVEPPAPGVTGSAEEVEAIAEAEAEEGRAADDVAVRAAAAEVAAQPLVEAPGAPADDSAEPEVVSEPATPESEAAAHPESAAEPADVTEETVADAPAHTDAEPPSSESDTASVTEADQSTEPTPDPGPTDLTPGPFPGAVEPLVDGSMPAGYEIKANAQSMLFHVPGSRYYKATRAEYWFDTEEHARAAGFIKPGETRD